MRAGSPVPSPQGDSPLTPIDRESPTIAASRRLIEGAGAAIGTYKLLQRLGEGGAGSGRRSGREPVWRRVALKVIKTGMGAEQVIARFEAERQALAMMDHTNIGRVLDAGQTDSGRPYFVMDLVKGVPITKYCDELHLTLRERLQLFIPVRQAIQHAHPKRIIHRDIKPNNVFVCMQDRSAHSQSDRLRPRQGAGTKAVAAHDGDRVWRGGRDARVQESRTSEIERARYRYAG
jgi:serine/threonine protein kinase